MASWKIWIKLFGSSGVEVGDSLMGNKMFALGGEGFCMIPGVKTVARMGAMTLKYQVYHQRISSIRGCLIFR